MLRYISPLKPQSLTSGNNTAYVVPSLCFAQIRALTFHNATNNTITVEAYLLPSNVSTVDNAQRLLRKSIGANESYLCPELINHVLPEGMKVVLTGQGVNAMLSVVEQSV